MKRVCVCGLTALAIAVATPVLAQDNPEGGWGAWFGNNYGTARTTAMPIIFEPGDEVEIAWEFNAHDTWGMRGLKGRQQMVFDAAGNLYWFSDDYSYSDHNRLVSLDSDGNLRWTFAGSDGSGLGKHHNRHTPIIGADAAYIASHAFWIYDESDPPVHVSSEWYVYAVNKTTGAQIWATQLDNEPMIKDGCCWKPNMTLLNGKLYALGIPHDDGTRAIYVIDAATGAILHNKAITDLPTDSAVSETNIVAVEEAFGVGTVGVYGTWADEVWGIRVNETSPNDLATGTALVWDALVGGIPWYAEKHVMFVEELDLIVTYGMNDAYGYDAFAFDLDEGDVYLDWGDSDAGDSGYFQSGALGFYDGTTVPMYVGAWPGLILEYAITVDGITYVGANTYSDTWGAVGNYMQILQNPADGHTIAVSSGAGVPSPVVMVDIDGDMTQAPEGPMYIDDVKLYTGPDTANLTLVYSDDFESYTLGSLIGQGGWADASESGSGEGPSQVVADPTGAANQVVEISPIIGDGSWEGIKQALSLADTNVYRIEYVQYLSNNTQNIYMALTDDPDGNHGCPWSYGWDSTTKMYAIGWENTWDAQTPMVEKAWESVVITHDYANEQSDIVLGGTKTDVVSWLSEGTPKDVYPANKPTGFAIQLSDTTANSNVPNAVIVNYNVGNTASAYLDQQIAGGPLVGPDGKIYYGLSDDNYIGAEARAGRIYALQPKVDGICADANCDGAINAFDIDPFVVGLVNQAQWEATYSCDYLTACDVNGDGAVNAFDIDPFVVALVSGGCQ